MVLTHQLQAISHKSKDDEILLLSLTDPGHNEVVKMKLGLGHLTFTNSENVLQSLCRVPE